MSTDDHGPVVPLDRILGPEQAAAVLARIATTLQQQDLLPEPVAWRLACERATDGDPLVLAAPGQVWQLRDDVDIDDAPARRLQVHLRLTEPPMVVVGDPDDDTGDGELDELLIEVLEMYHLVSWDTRFLAPNPAAG